MAAMAMGAAVEAVSLNMNPWDAAMTLERQFPNLEGVILHEVLRQTYVIAENVTLELFDLNPNEINGQMDDAWLEHKPEALIHKHDVNRDEEEETIELYTVMVEAQGAIKGVRAEPIAVPMDCLLRAPGSGERVKLKCGMVSANHLSKAIYRAAGRSPKNKFVLRTVLSGFQGVTLLDPRTPPHVLKYFVEKAAYTLKTNERIEPIRNNSASQYLCSSS